MLPDQRGFEICLAAQAKVAFTMQVKYGRLTVTFHGDAVVDGYKLLVSINHSEEHSVQLTEEELCSLLTNIDLDYPNIVKKQHYQQ